MVDKDTKYGTRRQLIKMAGVAGAGLASSAGVASASGSKGSSKGPKLKRWRCAGVGAKAWDGKGFDQASKVHARFKNKKGESLKFKFNDTSDLPQEKSKGDVTVELSKANLMLKGDKMRKGYALKRVWTPETGSAKNPKFGECFEHEPEKPECDITFHKNCRRVRVECDKKVTVKAYTKKKHKWGDSKVIEKKTKEFDWTLQKKGNYFTKVKVYYEGKKIARKKCDREKPDYDEPECEFHDDKVVIKNVPRNTKNGQVSAAVQKDGETKWSGVDLKWFGPGETRKKKGAKYVREDDKIVVTSYKPDGRLFWVNGQIRGKEFECKRKRHGKPDHGKPKCKFHSDKKVVVKNVPKKARKGSVAAAVRNKWGKTKWSGIGLKWVKPGDTRKKNGIKYERTDDKVIVTSYKSGWKLHRVKGDVMGKKFDCKNEDKGGHGCYCNRWNKKKVVIKNVPKRCRKGKVAACARKGSRTKWSGISLKWVKPGDTKWKNGVKYTRKHDKIVVECYKSGWDLHRVKGKIKGDKFDTNDH